MNILTTLDTPLGKVSVRIRDDKLCEINIGDECQHQAYDNNTLLKQLRSELDTYFADNQFHFSVPLDLHGTKFQQRVWQALSRIPVGETSTYGQLATQLNSSPRAVGNACRANPLPIIIPCHRVIAKQGLGGYDGQTSGKRLDIKRWLLKHEGVCIN